MLQVNLGLFRLEIRSVASPCRLQTRTICEIHSRFLCLLHRGFGAPMRCLAFSMAVAMAMRASGIREGPEGHTTVTTCSERVAMVLDNVYGRWLARKNDKLLLDDPFSTSQDTKEDLLKRLQKSMLFHCEWLVTSTSLLKVAFGVFLNIFGVYGFAMALPEYGAPKNPMMVNYNFPYEMANWGV